MRTIADAVAALEAGRTTSRALVEECLGRIADPAGEGARCFIKVYADTARASAEAMDMLRRSGRAPSRFAGLPVSLKDLFDVAGEPTPAGSVILANAAPAVRHAPVVQRLLAAGLVLVGRTNMTEFAFSGVGINQHYGTPRAPWGRDGSHSLRGHVPGGSSSGAAVSVSDGFALAAIGTDTGGSCRIPAALCGVTGYKPTQARVPREGVVPLSPTLDSVGPLAPSAACCAAIDAILAGEERADFSVREASGLRFLVPDNFVMEGLDASTEASFDRALRRLDRAGVQMLYRRLAAFDAAAQANARGGFAVAEAYAWHQSMLVRHGAQYDPRVASRMMPGAQMPARDYIALAAGRAATIALFESEMAGFDALLMPTVPIAPPPISAFARDDEYTRLNYLLLRNSAQINFFDGCAISLPCGEPGAPPAALTLARPAMGDHVLFEIAACVEAVIA